LSGTSKDKEGVGCPLPWQISQWSRLWQVREQRRLPHALILVGQQGMGKHRFALHLAKSVLCESPGEEGSPCGACRACVLCDAQTHPDLYRLEPESEAKSQEIKVDSVRDLIEKGVLTSGTGGYKVVLLSPADQMSTAAANSLLKTLEEPVPSTLILLVTEQPHRLPATILSRCQRVSFPPPDLDTAVSWLATHTAHPDPKLLFALAGRAPLKALALADTEVLQSREQLLSDLEQVFFGRRDAVAVAEQWSSQDARRTVEWICTWLIDILRSKASPTTSSLFHVDQGSRLQRIAQQLDYRQLFELLDQAISARQGIASTLNLQLMLEDLLISWALIRST